MRITRDYTNFLDGPFSFETVDRAELLYTDNNKDPYIRITQDYGDNCYSKINLAKDDIELFAIRLGLLVDPHI